MPDSGISRKVIFTAWYRRRGWVGPERDAKYVVPADLGGHNVDRHGSTPRIGAE